MRCPTCEATNPEGATFCGQCYARFDRPPASSPPPSPRPHADRPPVTAAVGRFAAVEGELTWRCGVCDTANPIAAFSCTVCGARMDAEAGEGAEVDWQAARRAEAVVPGLGHIRAGHVGMGAARMGIAVLWLLGGLVLAVGGGAGLATALPLLVGVGAVWATGPGDLDALRVGRSPRLDARGFMYLVTGVTLGVIVGGGIALIL